jgi:hypothetical protein
MKIILIRQAETGIHTSARSDASAYRVYINTSHAAEETAAMLFDMKEPPTITPLLDDMRSQHSYSFWHFLASKQSRETLRQLKAFLDQLETDDQDCIVICSGFILSVMKVILRFRGYCLEGGDLVPKPLDRIRATKQSLHCGGCHHNCLLSAPKCQIGQNKAARRL